MGSQRNPLKIPCILAAALILQTACLIRDVKATEQQSKKVLIIGAGAAGIAAAAKLVEGGIVDIAVLEAEDRIGGRIKSVKMGDTWVDLGAEWIHGKTDNTVYDLVKDLHITKDAKMTTDLYKSGGKRIDKEFADELWKIVIDYMKDDLDAHKDWTVDKSFEDSYNKAIKEKWSGDETKLQVAKMAFGTFKRCMESYEGTYDLSDATVSTHFVEHDNKNFIWVGHPYKIIFDIMMKKFPDPSKDLHITDKIFFNKEVTKIDTTHDKIQVDCADGTKYKADYVIFTPSLGVLKAKYKTLFEPQLPEAKQRVIEALGFGGVVKILVQFKENWWPETKGGFALVWSPEDKLKAKTEFSKGLIEGKDHTWLESLIGFFEVPQYKEHTNVLSIWVSGDAVKHVENLTEGEIIDGCMYLLKKFILPKTDKTEVPRPEKVIWTDWFKNKHFRGTYSYDSVKGKDLNVTNGDLGTPVGHLLFAGESTCPTYYSTVHGAIMTGRREAKRILKEIKT